LFFQLPDFQQIGDDQVQSVNFCTCPFIHRRIKVLCNSENRYLKAIRPAHEKHHKHHLMNGSINAAINSGRLPAAAIINTMR
jgi:hypothetical protein